MKDEDFINKLKYIASLPTNYYSISGGDWAKWNGKYWNFDCVTLIKSVLWGWSSNKNHKHGGAIYGSNGVYDDSADTIIKRCKSISTNFKDIQKGELLWMKGHVGIYIGNREVIECTAAWEGKVLYSKIGLMGERSRNGNSGGKWVKHGKIPYLTYDSMSRKKMSNDLDKMQMITYQAYTNCWLPEVNKCDNTEDGFAGVGNQSISGFRCKSNNGELIYETHLLGSNWIGAVSSKNYKKDDIKHIHSYAGIYGYAMDGIRIKSTYGNIKYRVKTREAGWLPWAMGFGNKGNLFAGIYGHKIIGIQIKDAS
jgi:hypothetical protein